MTDDWRQRRQALDPEESFIVQAPAGSGKTELLIQRCLKLLARVDSPESVVAITFTKKAAGEMRGRVLEALRDAAAGVEPEAVHQAATFQLAKEALARDDEGRWRLLENPARLRIQTIDSLCASITRQMPWLARFGAPPGITEKAGELYGEAARHTLRMAAEEERVGLHGPLSKLLLHLDNSFGQAERLISRMLEKRDQWLRHTGVNPDLVAVRRELEDALEELIGRQLKGLRAAIPKDAERDILLLLDLEELPGGLEDWRRLADLVLTKDGKPRKKSPPDVMRERWQRLADTLSRDEAMLGRLRELRRLPPARFEDSQWETMEALLDVLPKAVAHLQLVFRERGSVDFVELSIRASEALGQLEAPTDLALALGHRIQHLLLDEFQDTSFTQFHLLRQLTAGWQPRDGRTLFLVGDPMQSIYRFRQAEVELFLKARSEGIGGVRLTPLTLTANFRSRPALVEWVNETFPQVTPSAAQRNASPLDAPPLVHAFVGESHKEEAERVVELIGEPAGSVAVLVRARSHLTAVVAALRARGMSFQAIEIDALGERAIIQDLMALTFALLHLADRIAWLAVLRAPWCGLTLGDLTAIAGANPHATIWDQLRWPDLRISGDGLLRLRRCLPVLERALGERGVAGLRRLVEETWLRLGGPACVADEAGLADAAAYFDLLEGLEESGDLADFDLLRRQVKELFAPPDPQADGRLQIMTIHKAKGLEFDTVILPGLGHRPRREDEELLVWLEQEGRLLLAPMSATGEDRDPIYRYLNHLEHEKTRQESARLLYVAVTRARERLHLLGAARRQEKGDEPVAAEADSFLKLLWPAVGHHFVAAREQLAAETRPPARALRRLPVNWTLPAPPPELPWTREALEPAGEAEVTYEWVGDLLRHVGTVIHAFLQRIAAEGVAHWDARRVGESGRPIAAMLRNAGVPPVELAEAQARVKTALLRTIESDRGRWVLERRVGAESEHAVTGYVEGKLFQAVIDRTFVDEHGVRWIVDFKNSSHEGGKVEEFLDQEQKRYREQLERYAKLLAQTEDRPIKLALYFPLLDGWREWAAPEVRRRQASLFE